MTVPRITIVAAIAKNGVIGRDNTLPWRLPEDMKRFKALTMGQAVLMGRKTWESLPDKFRPLPGRFNMVVPPNANYSAEGAAVVTSIDDALRAVGDENEVFVIGGAEIYRLALPRAHRLQLTEINVEFDGDTYFPSVAREQWAETARDHHPANDIPFSYDFVTYDRVTYDCLTQST